MSPFACPAPTSTIGTAASRRWPRPVSRVQASCTVGWASSMNPPSTSTSSAASRAAQPLGERDELGHAGGVHGAVPDQQQRGRSDGSTVRRVQQGVDRGRGDRRSPAFGAVGHRRQPGRPQRGLRGHRPDEPDRQARPPAAGPPSPAAAQRTSSASAVGALPMAHTAPIGCRRAAARIPAADRVGRPARGRRRRRGRPASRATVAGRAVTPAATMRTSVTSAAPASSAARPARSACSSHTRSPAQLGSALVCTTRSTTARVSGGRSACRAGCAGSRTTRARSGAAPGPRAARTRRIAQVAPPRVASPGRDRWWSARRGV